ncbi:hypothetical protein [Streptomyces sp. NPDC088915]|uniref:hypothetical protein n=1 Tax=Streptomyces sp. NPDC088915 TaxID=3365912 RepID=UPI0038266467
MSLADLHTSTKIDFPWGITRSSLSLHVLALLVAVSTLVGCQTAPRNGAEGERPPARELVNLEDRITEYAGRAKDREPYTPLDGDQREHLAQGVGALLGGDLEGAGKHFSGIGFRVTTLTDAASGRRYHEVAARGPGAEARWGRLYVSADAAVRWSVQVPHPVSDRGTETLGARLLESAPGGALVVAGAHRTSGEEGAADVAHRTDSAFHVVITELQKRGVPGVQIHGFAKASDRPYDAILSTGAARTAPADAGRLAALMEDRRFRVCKGWSDRCPLEGTTNVQGRTAKHLDATFLHVELAPALRSDDAKGVRAREALAELLAGWAGAGR